MARVRFRFPRPHAVTVALAGDFNAWSTTAHPMQWSDDGEWTLGPGEGGVPPAPGRRGRRPPEQPGQAPPRDPVAGELGAGPGLRAVREGRPPLHGEPGSDPAGLPPARCACATLGWLSFFGSAPPPVESPLRRSAARAM